jgi:hypothetical protein
VNEAQRQLQFASTPARALTRTKKLPKAQAGQARTVVGFDRVLGYRIEQIEHQALWGLERHWQAVTHGGQVLRDETLLTLFDSSESASALAAGHARQHFPKRVALGRWGHIAWTGGEDYREWLITLPYYPTSYFSSHFSVRNILAHVRCDVREGADGERVLLLQEVQSDWAQNVRRAVSAGMMGPDDPECPPFWREWPALAMKLVLLHAAHQGLDAVAWTRGAHQVFRYNGLGATGLTELYDRTLPREVSRLASGAKRLAYSCRPISASSVLRMGTRFTPPKANSWALRLLLRAPGTLCQTAGTNCYMRSMGFECRHQYEKRSWSKDSQLGVEPLWQHHHYRLWTPI